MRTRRVRLTRAEAREKTREELLNAAERCFLERGYHATSIDLVAAEAGYTKGAVYGNFASKDDLFLALYERYVERGVEQATRAFADAGTIGGFERVIGERGRRAWREERWLAVFFEFWAHVIRQPEARARFAELHDRALEPFAAATERLAAEHGVEYPVEARAWNLAMNVMQLGLVLERLTQPANVAPDLGAQIQRFIVERLTANGGSREDGERT